MCRSFLYHEFPLLKTAPSRKMRRFDPKDASFTPEINFFFFLPLNPTNRLYMRSTAAEDSYTIYPTFRVTEHFGR